MNTNPDLFLEAMRRQMAGETPNATLNWLEAALNGNSLETPLYGWAIRNAAHALEPRDPLKYLVDQMLPYPSLSVVYGGPGSLKSMVLADLAVCVAGGKRWLDQLPSDMTPPGISLATEQASVLWIDLDNGQRRTDIRFGAILRAHSLDDTTPLYHVSMPVPHLDASNAIYMEALTQMVITGGYKLVIIDNLGLITGNVEENSAAMASVMGRLRRLAEDAECAVILIHHQRKSAVNAESNGVRKGESLRGHSSIEAALDLALLIERKPNTDAIAIIATKVRDFLSFGILGAQFTYEHVEGTRDLWLARFFSTVTQTSEERAEQILRDVILDVVKESPGIKTMELVNAVRDDMAARKDAKNVGINTVRGTIKKMVEDGSVRRSGNIQEYKHYAA